MTNSTKEFLSHFGWDDFFESQVLTLSSQNLFLGRVVNEEKNFYRLQVSRSETMTSVLTGKMKYEARTRSELPAIGDWVLAEIPQGSSIAVIRFIFERKNILHRKRTGEVSEVQILAANVDYVMVASSINSDLNFGRLERYLTFAWESKATPVVLLTKSDLSSDLEADVASVRERFPGVHVFALSRNDFESSDFLRQFLSIGKTCVLVGSSGVGKSTLANYLIGENIIVTQEIRSDDDKGMHTTTSRNLYESFYGGLIIDTPGMRELQFSSHEEGLEHQFGDIEDLISKCHFSNCKHQTEKNCAVVMALENGKLDEARWKSFRKLAGEVRYAMRKQSKWIMAEDKKAWKKRSILSRQKYKGWQ